MPTPRAVLFAPLLPTVVTPQSDTHLPNPGAVLALATLCNATCTGDETLVDQWGAWAGYDSAQITVTPGTTVPNYSKAISPDGCVFAFCNTECFEQLVKEVIGSIQVVAQSPHIEDATCRLSAFVAYVEQCLWAHVQADMAGLPSSTPVTLVGHSLGGAIAAAMAFRMKRFGYFDVRNVVSLGRPKVGNAAYTNRLAFTVGEYRILFQDDVVPQLPPAAPLGFLDALNPLPIGYSYAEAGFPWIIDTSEDTLRRVSAFNQFDQGALINAARTLAHGDFATAYAGTIAAHQLQRYCDSLRLVCMAHNNIPSFSQLDDINKGVPLLGLNYDPDPADPSQGGWGPNGSDWDFANPGAPPPVGPAPLANAHPTSPVTRVLLADNSGSVNLGVGALTTPAQVRVTTPPIVPGAMFQAIVAAGDSVKHVFHGRDRRMLKKLVQMIERMWDRDVIADLAKKTSLISTRDHFVDPGDFDTEEAITTVYNHVIKLLYLIKSS